jgi:hypothetical protein
MYYNWELNTFIKNQLESMQLSANSLGFQMEN